MQYFLKSIRLLKHLFSSRHIKGFGVHSPYIFRQIRFVIYEKSSYYVFTHIENLRRLLLKNNCKIQLNDFGTGKSVENTVSRIASRSLKSRKYGQLLYRLVKEHKPKTIIELGTSLGITTLYLASASNADCYTFEGSKSCIDIAKANFIELNVSNIHVFEGDIDLILKEKLELISDIDFAFIDANHKYESVLKYFDLIVSKAASDAIIVIDDINWSSDMNRAWNVIKENDCVTSSIDLFEMGILFLNPILNKKHYKLIF